MCFLFNHREENQCQLTRKNYNSELILKLIDFLCVHTLTSIENNGTEGDDEKMYKPCLDIE